MMRLHVALTLLLMVAVYADPVPAPHSSGETDETPVPAEYSWEAGLFGNLVPGLGYFLIGEPVWGVVELGIMRGGLIIPSSEFTGLIVLICIEGGAYLGRLINAPLLAEWKNEHQSVSLNLSPGMGVAGNGECCPTLNLALRF